ncbi:MAG: nuclear pore complex subunit [Crocinitomicaceae bacterium]|nr:nuclear pore complex subunit [Crocinitomicaceae bacterium]
MLYYKESTKETPIVSLNSEKGVLLIDGNCESETPDEFFTEITDWINNYSKKPQETTTLTINLGGINISSSKYLLNIIYQLEALHKENFKVRIRWVYKNGEDGNYELGKDYDEMVSFPFEFIETVENFVSNI